MVLLILIKLKNPDLKSTHLIRRQRVTSDNVPSAQYHRRRDHRDLFCGDFGGDDLDFAVILR